MHFQVGLASKLNSSFNEDTIDGMACSVTDAIAGMACSVTDAIDGMACSVTDAIVTTLN